MAADPLTLPSLRLFLALPVHEIFHQEIECVLDKLGSKVNGVKWSRIKQVHLTLHFFGATPSNQVERIDAAMQKVARLFAPLQVTLGSLGAFPDVKEPNIIWLGIQEQKGMLLSLFKMIQTEVKKLGFKIESRPFHPHVTLGRVKKRWEIGAELQKFKFEFAESEKAIHHFSLYQSHCLSEGARYEVLKTYALSSNAAT